MPTDAGCAAWSPSRFQSSISTTPSRHSTAYSSRNGISITFETTVNGSDDGVAPVVVATPSTVRTVGVQISNTP